MVTPALIIETEPAPAQVQYLEDRLYEFNSRTTGITDGEWLTLFVRDRHSHIVAGICGNTWGDCCEIRPFWVEESRRRQGLGTRLLGAAEDEARRRGWWQMILTTFSFQAPAFYAKHGFQVVAVVDDYPRGHQSLLLRKALVHHGGTCQPVDAADTLPTPRRCTGTTSRPHGRTGQQW